VLGCACDTLDRCTCGAAYLARRGRDPEPRPGDVLHVTNGESAGNTLRQTGLGGAVLSWRDVLYEGPLPAGPPERQREARAAFLSECGWGSRPALLDSFERRDRLLLRSLEDGRQVVLWFEHDLYDQLQLLDVLALVAESDVPFDTLELIVVGSFPGRPGFRGLGELSASELESLWGARAPATAAVAALAAEVWEAVRAPTPEGVALFAAAPRGLEGLPFAAAALQRLLDELPGVRDGLSGTERRALAAVAQGAATPVDAFLVSQSAEETPFLGDAWFFRALASLGSGEARLVETAAGDALPLPPPLGDAQTFGRLPLRPTRNGARVLAGKADRVALLGLDRWVGGTHLVPGAVWRWDGERSLLVAPPA